MTEAVNYEKLASVFNQASAQGKASFCKMLWGNQPEGVQSKLAQLLNEQALEMVTGQR